MNRNLKRILRRVLVSGFLVLTVAMAGCNVLPERALSGPASEVTDKGFRSRPRVRYGSYATANLGTTFLDARMGKHGYSWPFFEKNGIAYTRRGGHIDVIHLRIAIDWTAYLTAKSYRHVMEGEPGFSTKLAVDRSRNYVRISYPPGWDTLPEEDRSIIAREVAFAMGPYLAFTMVTWHEILTWYGFKCMGLPVEFASAFSWEDSYSNLLGTIVAVKALQDTEHSYNKAVEIALKEEMEKLGIQPARVARQASASVRGDWYTGGLPLFVDMKKRNFDIGLDDGYITPTLVPDVPGCEGAEPLSYPVPTLDVLHKYGFSLTVEIEPREWESRKILRTVHEDGHEKRVNPEQHFSRIMDHILRQAADKYGPEYEPEGEDCLQYVSTGE